MKKEDMKMPSIFKSKKWRKLERELTKPPKVRVTKVRVTPLMKTKSERDQAKLFEKLINYQFKHNTDGLASKYMQVIKLASDEFLAEQLYGIRVSWDSTQRMIDKRAKKPKEFADMLNKLK